MGSVTINPHAWRDRFRTLAIKILALFSFCGGPLLVADRLKPHCGRIPGFVIAFGPVGLLAVGALALSDSIKDRLARRLLQQPRALGVP